MSADYLRPAGLAEAVDTLATFGKRAKVIAGGTDLMVKLRKKRAKGEAIDLTLIDVNDLSELSGVRQNDSELIVGAAVTFARVQSDPAVARWAPLLAEAARTVGSLQIRNVATLGGNVANLSPAADGWAALVALNARARLISSAGERSLPVGSLNGWLRPDELIVSFTIPKPACPAGGVFFKVIRRQAVAIARFSVSAQIEPGQGRDTIEDVSLCLGAVFPEPRRIDSVEQRLVGERPSTKVFAEAGRRAAEAMLAVSGRRPSMVYKEPAVSRTVARALDRAWHRASEVAA